MALPPLTLLQQIQRLHLPQHLLQQLLPPNRIQMTPHLAILSCKPLHLRLRQPPAKPAIQFPGEIVIEFREEFDVQEEDGRGGEFVGDDVEEDFRAGVFGGWVGALAGFEGGDAHPEDGGAVAEEEGFASCSGVVSGVNDCGIRYDGRKEIGGRGGYLLPTAPR